MRILFLVPPPLDGCPAAERIFGCNYGIYPQPNLFVLYPATVLKRLGHEVAVLDFPIRRGTRRDFDKFTRTQRFDIVFFHTVFLSRRTDLAARDLLRAHCPATKYVFTATEPSADPSAFVAADSVVIRGEPESVAGAVVDALAAERGFSGVRGVSWLDSGRLVNEPAAEVLADLDALPFPDRTLLGAATGYHNPKLSRQPFTTMVASRGCPHACYYCVPNSQSFAREIEFKREHGGHKPPVRQRSAANVVAEFRALAESGYRAISFVDDQFLWAPERTFEICEGLAGSGVEWSCLARSDRLQDPAIARAMGRAGCRYVDIGIESFHQPILDYIGKELKVETVYTAVENLRAAGVEPELNVLLGSCPLETHETMEKTFKELVKLDVDYVLFSVCTPFPHTRFNEVAKREGWMIKPRYEAIDPIKQSFISYPHLTRDQLEKALRSMYRRFYFRPRYLWRRLRQVRGPRDMLNKVRAALSILR